MCRMMAAPSGIPGRVVADAFLRMARGENALNERNTSLGLVKHGDGWGAVLETGGRTIRVRSPRPCWDDPAFAQVQSTSVRLLHARLASSAGRGEVHAHPFSTEIDGETWTFCHNGTIRDLPDDGSGATDSERFFRRLAPMLASTDPVTAFETVAAPLRDVTSLNSLLLGPTGLWAFCVWTDPSLPRVLHPRLGRDLGRSRRRLRAAGGPRCALGSHGEQIGALDSRSRDGGSTRGATPPASRQEKDYDRGGVNRTMTMSPSWIS